MRNLLLAMWLVACGSTEPAPPPEPRSEPAPSAPEPPAPEPPAPRSPGALSGSMWTFYDPPGPLPCFAGTGLAADCDTHLVDTPRVFHARGGRLVREDGDTVVFDVALTIPGDARELVVGLSPDSSELRVAAVTSDGGVVVERRSASDGALIGLHHVASPGSPATRVQIDAGDAIVLRVLAERPWSAMLDADDGALVDVAEVGLDLAALAPDASRSWIHAEVGATSGDLTARRSEVRSRGAATWRTHLDDPFGCGSYALVELGTEVALLSHCGGTSGSDLYFLDRATGAVVARTMGGNIGSIGHSMYHSSVDVALDDGLLFVRGVESGGTYVCVIDAREHRPRACLIHRR